MCFFISNFTQYAQLHLSGKFLRISCILHLGSFCVLPLFRVFLFVFCLFCLFPLCRLCLCYHPFRTTCILTLSENLYTWGFGFNFKIIDATLDAQKMETCSMCFFKVTHACITVNGIRFQVNGFCSQEVSHKSFACTLITPRAVWLATSKICQLNGERVCAYSTKLHKISSVKVGIANFRAEANRTSSLFGLSGFLNWFSNTIHIALSAFCLKPVPTCR